MERPHFIEAVNEKLEGVRRSIGAVVLHAIDRFEDANDVDWETDEQPALFGRDLEIPDNIVLGEE